jgi:hypothetical protein
MVLKRVGIASAAKLAGALYAAIGLIVGTFFALMSLAGVSLPMEHEGSPPAWIGPVLGVGAIVVLPLFYGVMGVLAGAVSAALFNVIARLAGGLEVELE